MATQVYFAVSAVAFIIALVVIGAHPNRGWQEPVAWIITGFFAVIGLIALGFAIWTGIDETNEPRY